MTVQKSKSLFVRGARMRTATTTKQIRQIRSSKTIVKVMPDAVMYPRLRCILRNCRYFSSKWHPVVRYCAIRVALKLILHNKCKFRTPIKIVIRVVLINKMRWVKLFLLRPLQRMMIAMSTRRVQMLIIIDIMT